MDGQTGGERETDRRTNGWMDRQRDTHTQGQRGGADSQFKSEP